MNNDDFTLTDEEIEILLHYFTENDSYEITTGGSSFSLSNVGDKIKNNLSPENIILKIKSNENVQKLMKEFGDNVVIQTLSSKAKTLTDNDRNFINLVMNSIKKESDNIIEWLSDNQQLYSSVEKIIGIITYTSAKVMNEAKNKANETYKSMINIFKEMMNKVIDSFSSIVKTGIITVAPQLSLLPMKSLSMESLFDGILSQINNTESLIAEIIKPLKRAIESSITSIQIYDNDFEKSIKSIMTNFVQQSEDVRKIIESKFMKSFSFIFEPIFISTIQLYNDGKLFKTKLFGGFTDGDQMLLSMIYIMGFAAIISLVILFIQLNSNSVDTSRINLLLNKININ